MLWRVYPCKKNGELDTVNNFDAFYSCCYASIQEMTKASDSNLFGVVKFIYIQKCSLTSKTFSIT